jgi:hypothetical protein
MLSLDLGKKANRLPNYVQDVSTATCVFCPYGADVRAGDRVYAFDEKTIFDRKQRERLVKVTAVKPFRSTGRMVTLDLKIATPDELAQIIQDSEVTMESLLEHRSGSPTYDSTRPPVVVYFEACKEDDTIGSQFRKRSRARVPHLLR